MNIEYNVWKWKVGNEKVERTPKKEEKEEKKKGRDKFIDFNDFNKSFNKKDNNKEISSKRLAEREMVKQITYNPYLSNNDYLSDLNVQESFLKSKNSNFENLEY